MQTRSTEAGAGELVIRWRETQLRAIGFTGPAAGRLANDHRYDLHGLIELVERGCPPELAERILAPLDAETRLP